MQNVGFPWSPSHVNCSLSSVGGTVAAALHVCEEKQILFQQWQWQWQWQSSSNYNNHNMPLLSSAHVAGWSYHVFCDYGEEFCIFSDVAVAANVVLQNYSDIGAMILRTCQLFIIGSTQTSTNSHNRWEKQSWFLVFPIRIRHSKEDQLGKKCHYLKRVYPSAIE